MKDTVSEGMMTVIVIALAALVLGGGKLIWDKILYPKISGEIIDIEDSEYTPVEPDEAYIFDNYNIRF